MNIAIRELDEGINEFEKTVQPENYNLPDGQFYTQDLSLKIFVDRLENLFRFKISVSTTADYICDRCLESFPYRFSDQIEQIYQLGHSDFDGDEIEILPENSKDIDISKVITDAFILSRPIRLLCREDCKGLCASCGTKLNQRTCDCKQNEIDPRLEKLKKLLK